MSVLVLVALLGDALRELPEKDTITIQLPVRSGFDTAHLPLPSVDIQTNANRTRSSRVVYHIVQYIAQSWCLNVNRCIQHATE